MNLNSRVKMFDAVLSENPTSALGGRSMGARAAVLAAKEKDDIKHLVLVSYPLHNGEDVRDQILLDIPKGVNILLIIGDGDDLCELSRLEDVRKKMHAKSWMIVVRGTDHRMNVKPSCGTKEMGELSGEISAKWLQESDEKTTEGAILWETDGQGSAVWSGWKTGSGIRAEGPQES